MTYSIVALDPTTGDLGVAVQSKFLAVGAVVPWAAAGVGAVATQSFANVTFGPGGLARMASGMSAGQALERLVSADPLRSQRQVGMVDVHGGAATHTGGACFAWAGGLTGPGFAAQGNILAGASVVDGLVDTLVAGGRPFPELLVACLAAADAQGGDRRGRESASLLVVRAGGGYGGANDRWVDLRVDHDDDPIGQLGGLLDLQRLYLDRPAISDLTAVDEALAAELRALLTKVGAEPGGRFGNVYQPMNSESAEAGADTGERPMTGTPGLPALELGHGVAGSDLGLDGRREPGGAHRGSGLDRPSRPHRPTGAGEGSALDKDERPSVQPTAVLVRWMSASPTSGDPPG